MQDFAQPASFLNLKRPLRYPPHSLECWWCSSSGADDEDEDLGRGAVEQLARESRRLATPLVRSEVVSPP